MENWVKVALLLLIVSIVFFSVRMLLIRHLTKKILNSVMKDERSFNELIDSFLVKALFTSFNREFMRLNYYVAHESSVIVGNQFDKMYQMKLTKKQRATLLQIVYQYFLSQKDARNVKKYQKLLVDFYEKNNFDKKMIDDINLTVRILIDGDVKTLGLIEKNIKATEKDEKASWYLKKAYVLKCDNRLEEAKEAVRKAIENTTQAFQVQLLQQMLEDDLKAL